MGTKGGVHASWQHTTLTCGSLAASTCPHRAGQPTGRLSQHRELQHTQHRCAVRDAAPPAKTAARQPQWTVGSSLTCRALRSFQPLVRPVYDMGRTMWPRSTADSKEHQGLVSCRASPRTAATGPPPAGWLSCASRSGAARCSTPSSETMVASFTAKPPMLSECYAQEAAPTVHATTRRASKTQKNETLTHDTANLVTSSLTAREHNFIRGGSKLP